MKIPKNSIFWALYISDVHFLLDGRVREHSHQDLLNLLDRFYERNVRFFRIVLVGDIVESWYFSSEKRFKADSGLLNKLFGRLDKLAMFASEKYYIIGNHDTTSFSMQLDRTLARYLEKNNWQVSEKVEGEHFIAVHGHQGQYSKLTWIMDIFFVRLFFTLGRIFPKFFKWAERFYQENLNHKDPRNTEEAIAYYSKLSKTVNQGNRLMISGHTHEMICIPELNIINTGDWIKSRTFVLQKESRFIGCKLENNKIKKVFRYDLKALKNKKVNTYNAWF